MGKSKNTLDTFSAFGVDLVKFEPMEQVEVYQYLAEKADIIRRKLGKGAYFKVNIACGLLQVSFHGGDLQQVEKELMEMQVRAEFKIPGDRADDPLHKYLVRGSNHPIWAMLSMVSDAKSKGAISDDRRKALMELGSTLMGAKMSKAAKSTASNANDYIAIGFGVDHLNSVEQMKLCRSLAGQINRFAHGLDGGSLGTVNLVSGLLQFSVTCRDPEKAAMDLMMKMKSGDMDIPENDEEISIFEHLVIGHGDPITMMFEMPDKDDTGAYKIAEIMQEEGIEISETTDPLIQAAKWALERRVH